MSEKVKYNIRILGHNYTIISDKSTEIIEDLTDKINSKLSELKKNNPNLKHEMILSLGLLYFSEEIISKDLELDEYLEEIDSFKLEKKSIKDKTENYLKNIKDLKHEKEALKENIIILENSIEQLDKEIINLRLDISNNSINLENKNIKIEELNSDLSNLRKDYTQALIIINSVKRELEKIKGKV